MARSTDGLTSSGAVVHVVGARPNFVKAAPVIGALAELGVTQRLVHTGQHYDPALSSVFFEELDLPDPDIHLGVGSGSQARQTAALLEALEPVFVELRPNLVVVYGDVNSTLAAALVAAKLQLPIAHVEAGLRSFDDSMPEEVNRRITDLLARLLFVTAPEGIENLAATGAPPDRVHFVGNPMIDTLLRHLDRIDAIAAAPTNQRAEPYAVATIHRPSNVDDPGAAARVVEMLAKVTRLVPVVLPLHPRGKAALDAAGLQSVARLEVVEPLGYLEFLALVRRAALVLTDSGGIQEETTMLGIPCITVRPNTERPVTITHGTNRLTDPAGADRHVAAVLRGAFDRPESPPPLWDGHAGERIAAIIRDWLQGDRSGPAGAPAAGR